MEDEIDIKELLLALWRKKVIIIVVTCLFFVIGICLYGRTITKKTNNKKATSESINKSGNSYVETDFIFSRGVNKELDGVTSTYKLTIDAGVIANLNKFATSTAFLQGVIDQLPSAQKLDVNDIKENIMVLGNGTGDIMMLVVINEDEEVAAKISNAILIELTNKINKLYKIEELIVIDGPKKLNEEEIVKLNSKETEGAEIQNASSGMSKKKVVLITAAGFVLACGVIIVIEILDGSVRNEKQLEDSTCIKTLVRLPNKNDNVVDRTELLRINVDTYQTILVTSPERQDGKSFVAMNLAKAFASLGRKTLLIDTKSILNENIEEIKESDNKNLSILLSDKNSGDLAVLSDSDIENKINKLKENYDNIIIDSGNILEDANTLAIAKVVKNVIIVTAERKTKLENVVRTKKYIENIDGNLLGNVLNKAVE